MIKPCSILFLLFGLSMFTKKPDTCGPNNRFIAIQDTAMGHTLIIKVFNANALKVRKSKKQLFIALADSLPVMLKEEMQKYDHRLVEINGWPYLDIAQEDSAVYQLLQQKGAVYAVVVRDIDVHFEQKDVEITKDESGTHRNANYDIYSVVKYAYYDTHQLLKSPTVSIFHHFSNRSVMSGLFAAGPDITSNREAAFAILRENAVEYCRSSIR